MIEARDTGKPLTAARADITATARYFEFYAGAADKLHGQVIPYLEGFSVNVQREPHGVPAQVVTHRLRRRRSQRRVHPCEVAGPGDEEGAGGRGPRLLLEAEVTAGVVVVTTRGSTMAAAVAAA